MPFCLQCHSWVNFNVLVAGAAHGEGPKQCNSPTAGGHDLILSKFETFYLLRERISKEGLASLDLAAHVCVCSHSINSATFCPFRPAQEVITQR